MFAAFFYLLRFRGIHVTLNEWVMLLSGMEKGLHHSSLTGFYYLCRAVLIKSETDFDHFDQVFLEYFKDVPFYGELPQELLDWLNHPCEDLMRTLEELKSKKMPDETMEKILQMLQERLQEQKEEHNGGVYWVGTQGRSPFGNSGWRPGTIRVGGESCHRAAALVAGERRYRDFRKDATLDSRQFQVAFRRLRQLSAQEGELEIDVDGTVQDTCEHAGVLHIQKRKARSNTVKVLLLMDSGGSMDPYVEQCARLFQAVRRTNHFKELHIYYFHNCIYGSVFKTPELSAKQSVPIEWLLKSYGDSYKVIIVGDAAMNPYELNDAHYNWNTGIYEASGLSSLESLMAQYPYLIWLNPRPLPKQKNFWTQTHLFLSQIVPMFELTVEGLENGMKRLMVKK